MLILASQNLCASLPEPRSLETLIHEVPQFATEYCYSFLPWLSKQAETMSPPTPRPFDQYIVNAEQGLLLAFGTHSNIIGQKLNKSNPTKSPVFTMRTFPLPGKTSQEGCTLQDRGTGRFLVRSGTGIVTSSNGNAHANWDIVMLQTPGRSNDGLVVFKQGSRCLTMEDNKTVTYRTYHVGQKSQQWWIGDIGHETDLGKMVKQFEDENRKRMKEEERKKEEKRKEEKRKEEKRKGEKNRLKGLGLSNGASNREIGEAIARKLVSEFGLPLDQARYKAMLMWGNGSGAADARAFELRSLYGFRGLSPGNYGTGDPYRLI